MKYFLIVCVFFVAACSESSSDGTVDSSSRDSMRASSHDSMIDIVNPVLDTVPASMDNGAMRTADVHITGALNTLIPDGYVILDTMTGDLNRDEHIDILVILKNPAEDSQDDVARPLLLLTGVAKGMFVLAARNDSVVLCKSYGGIWGDPYEGMAIKNGYFSIEHFGGSTMRWTRIITFKYQEAENTWYLHRDATVDFSIHDPSHTGETAHNVADYGKVKFIDYRNFK